MWALTSQQLGLVFCTMEIIIGPSKGHCEGKGYGYTDSISCHLLSVKIRQGSPFHEEETGLQRNDGTCQGSHALSTYPGIDTGLEPVSAWCQSCRSFLLPWTPTSWSTASYRMGGLRCPVVGGTPGTTGSSPWMKRVHSSAVLLYPRTSPFSTKV